MLHFTGSVKNNIPQTPESLSVDSLRLVSIAFGRRNHFLDCVEHREFTGAVKDVE